MFTFYWIYGFFNESFVGSASKINKNNLLAITSQDSPAMWVNRKRPCSESDAYPDSKKRQLFSHPADATSTSLPSLVSKRVFNTLKESPTDTTSPDARLRTRQTAEVWLRGQQHSDSAQISDTIKSSVEEAHVVNPAVEGITEGPRISKTSTLREDTCFAPPQTSWKSREGTKSASLSTHNLHQKPRGSPRSLHLEESRSRERSILPPSRAPATLGSFTGKTALKQVSPCNHIRNRRSRLS